MKKKLKRNAKFVLQVVEVRGRNGVDGDRQQDAQQQQVTLHLKPSPITTQ